MKFKIYRNYGVLGREKREVYTYGGQHPQAMCSDEITVELPQNKFFSVYENFMGDVMVETADGYKYTVNDVLYGRDKPCFQAWDDEGNKKRVYLKEVEE